MSLPYRYLLVQMAREEYRLHASLFGGRRFALFPLFIALVAGGTAAFFGVAGAASGTLVAGLHVLVGTLGLQVGTVGLVGRDALEDLLGDTTLLLFSARTLPVSMERLLVAFVVKDVGYYAVLFLAPLVAGLAPLVVLGDLAPTTLPLVFLTATGMFALGVGASLALVGVYTRSRAAVLAVVAALALGFALRGGALLAVTPYGLLAAPSPGALAVSLLGPPLLGAVGVRLFRFERSTPSRTAADRFRWLHSRLPWDAQGTLSKSLLDVARSSGGLWKVVFSQGLVFAVLALLLQYLPNVVPVRPAPGLTISAILALGTFTTYNWLCQFDDARFYLRYPVTLDTVFAAKLRGFLLLALPPGVAYLLLGGVVFGFDAVLVGTAVFVPLSLYVFGVTAYVAGLEPTELLFDTPTFALFTLAMMLVLLPLVVFAIAYSLDPALYAGLAVAVAGASAGVGLGLYRRAGGRWTAHATR
jgi:hypothetical protein